MSRIGEHATIIGVRVYISYHTVESNGCTHLSDLKKTYRILVYSFSSRAVRGLFSGLNGASNRAQWCIKTIPTRGYSGSLTFLTGLPVRDGEFDISVDLEAAVVP